MYEKKSGMQYHEGVGAATLRRMVKVPLNYSLGGDLPFCCYVLPMLPVSWGLGQCPVFPHINISAVEHVIFILSRVKKDELLHISANSLLPFWEGRKREALLPNEMPTHL